VRGALDLVFDTARGRVHFEVIGAIKHIELIAEGRGVRIKRFLAADTAAGAGASCRATPSFDWRMVGYAERRFPLV
jgi:hypothetical protein